jgi:hypothetical protein
MVNSVDSLWSATAGSQAVTKKKSATQLSFSKVLNDMKMGKIDTSDIPEDQKTLSVVTRTMSDGSTVVIVMVGDKIVSERKFGGSAKPQKDPTLVDTHTEIIGKLDQKNNNSDQLAADGTSTDNGGVSSLGGSDLYVNIR